MNVELKKRLAPFTALLDARYFPLLVAALPQAHTIYKWLWLGSDRTEDSWLFSVVGALGFEMVYVGAIAWAEGKQEGKDHSFWFWMTALTSLVFSTVVAAYTFWPTQPGWAILHSGFPIVAFAYTMLIHSATKQEAPARPGANLLATKPKLVTGAADGGSGDILSLHELLEETEPVLVAANIEPELNATDQRKAEILAARLQGQTWEQIAQRFGKSVRTVQLWAK